MATHQLQLGVSVSEKTQVGNSISTLYSWNKDSRELKVYWKYEKPQIIEIPSEIERVLVVCGGGRPNVVPLTPPKDPIAKIAWDFGFYSKKRLETLSQAIDASRDSACCYYDVPRGHDVNDPLIVSGKSFYFVYSVHMEGQIWSPYKWWAVKNTPPEEIRKALEDAQHSKVYGNVSL